MQSRLIFYNFKNKPENLRLYIHCLLNVKYIVNKKKKKIPRFGNTEDLLPVALAQWLFAVTGDRGFKFTSYLGRFKPKM